MYLYQIIFLQKGILKDNCNSASMRRLYLLLILSLWLVFTKAFPQDSEGINLSGYFRSELGLFGVYSNSQINLHYLGKNTLRLSFANIDDTFGKFEGSFDFHLISGKYSQFLLYQTNSLKIGEETFLVFDLRKLYLKLSFDFFDLSIGRQLIRFGQSVIFSPINFFDKLDISDFNLSRVGVDSVKIKFPLGTTGDITLVGLPRSYITNSDIAAKIAFSSFGFDFLGVITYLSKGEWINSGFAFKGDLGVEIYGETVYHYNQDETKRYFDASIGIDYSLYEKLLFRIEYYYTSFNHQNFNVLELQNLTTYPFVSKNYLGIQFSLIPTIIDNLTFWTINNLEKEGFITYLGYTRNLYQNVSLYLNFELFYKDISGIYNLDFNNFYTSIFFEVKW